MALAINWLVIGILVIVGIIAIKLNHLKHRFFIILLILLALFLYSSAALVNNNNDIDLKSSEGIFSAIKVYTGWLANGFENVKELTGKAIKMDWTRTDGEFFRDGKRR
ncbi:hypothetical protein CMI42_05285 [Candidatus Pacearchaeota archaeon]|nr:hypothetical protein [Candidatus Pacearchaeota archaeon]|tara:strand:+ start:708 stop:1031 length:324 start_codon:yes stop_codon:yes gene_type:complete